MREADIEVRGRHVELVNGRKASTNAANLCVDGKAHHKEQKRARAALAVPVRRELARTEGTVRPAVGQLGRIVQGPT